MFCTIREMTHQILIRSNTSPITFSSSLNQLRYDDFRANYEGLPYASDVEIEFEATETIYISDVTLFGKEVCCYATKVNLYLRYMHRKNSH